MSEGVEGRQGMSDDLVRVSLEDGKYEVIQSAEGRTYALRYGEPWRELVGDTLTLSMAYRIEELEAKLAAAEKSAEDAKACLNSWFDTKKLAREQVDPKVVEAASDYLRVSCIGGMETHKSNLVLDVIRDMAFRGVFSSIYTQFALAELKGDKE